MNIPHAGAWGVKSKHFYGGEEFQRKTKRERGEKGKIGREEGKWGMEGGEGKGRRKGGEEKEGKGRRGREGKEEKGRRRREEKHPNLHVKNGEENQTFENAAWGIKSTVIQLYTLLPSKPHMTNPKNGTLFLLILIPSFWR